MNGLAIPTTILAFVITNPIDTYVTGFSTLPTVSNSGRTWQSKAIDVNAKPRKTTLFGILDELMEEENGGEADETNNNSHENQQLVELYHSLIFASNLENEISKQLADCTDPSFLEYLTASSNSSQDKEEQQGLLDLIGQIEEVKTKMEAKARAEKEAVAAAKAKQEAEIEDATITTASAKNSKAMSNADVLRKASEIDAAIALSDEEKPSDFMSDCREVVNLSRGFNDSGQMRVGGG